VSGSLGRVLILFGLILVVAGAWLLWGPRIPWLGRLPGDLSFGGAGWRVYIPLGTSLVLSLVLSLLLWLLSRR
jgi:hypothetical protein